MGFDATILWLIVVGVAMLVAGLFAGYSLRGRDAQVREAKLQTELGSVRDSFDEHQRRVTKHFERSSDLFRDLTRHYAALYAHLSQGAKDFCRSSSPSLGAELRALLEQGELGMETSAHAANDFPVAGQPLGVPPGAPPPPSARHTLEASLRGTGADGQASGAAAGFGESPTRGERREAVATEGAAQGEEAPQVEVMSAGAEQVAQAKPARSNEGIREWLARLDARERDEEQRFSSGYERSYRSEVEGSGRGSGAGRAEEARAAGRPGAPDGSDAEASELDSAGDWDGRDLVDQRRSQARSTIAA